MIQLEPGFSAEVDRNDPGDWAATIRKFADANFYQTYPYESVGSGPAQVSQVILKRGGKVVGAAQLRIVRFPYLLTGIAYIRWGPLWKLRGEAADPIVFRQILRALRNEYACRRGYLLRIATHLATDESEGLEGALKSEGYENSQRRQRPRTIIMDLRPEIEALYLGLHQKWRNCLNSARKQSFEFLEGEGEDLIEAFEPIYAHLQERKQFSSKSGFHNLKRIQSALTTEEKLKISLCKLEGEICAGVICSAIGDRGLYLFGATSPRGLKCNASYILQWKMIEWLKERGCLDYNLNGINPVKNEGTYRFKARLAGKHGRDVHFLGCFDAYPGALVKTAVTFGEFLKAKLVSRRTPPPKKETLAPESLAKE